MVDHSILFHKAPVRVHHIATNHPFNAEWCQDIREVVNNTPEEARRAIV
jgi:hypothetical protein